MKSIRPVVLPLVLALVSSACGTGAAIDDLSRLPGPTTGPGSPQNPTPQQPSPEDDFTRFPRTFYRPLVMVAEKITVDAGPYLDDRDIAVMYLVNPEDQNGIFGCVESEDKKTLGFVLKKKAADGSLDLDLRLEAYSSIGYFESVQSSLYPYRTYPSIKYSGKLGAGKYLLGEAPSTATCLFEAQKREGQKWIGNLICKNVRTKNLAAPIHFSLAFSCDFIPGTL